MTPTVSVLPREEVLDEQAVHEDARQTVQEQLLISNKTYLTRLEAAKYLQVSEKSIGEWSKRPLGEIPFPESSISGEPATSGRRLMSGPRARGSAGG